MFRKSFAIIWAGLACVWFCSGCAMWNDTRHWFTGKVSGQSEPEIPDDKWAFVGKEGRGNRRMEKEDPLDRLLWSETARDINRNVGFE